MALVNINKYAKNIDLSCFLSTILASLIFFVFDVKGFATTKNVSQLDANVVECWRIFILTPRRASTFIISLSLIFFK